MKTIKEHAIQVTRQFANMSQNAIKQNVPCPLGSEKHMDAILNHPLINSASQLLESLEDAEAMLYAVSNEGYVPKDNHDVILKIRTLINNELDGGFETFNEAYESLPILGDTRV